MLVNVFITFMILPSHQIYPRNSPSIYLYNFPGWDDTYISRKNASDYWTQASPEMHPISALLSKFTCFRRNYEITARIKVTSRSIQSIKYIKSLHIDTIKESLLTHRESTLPPKALQSLITSLSTRGKPRG